LGLDVVKLPEDVISKLDGFLPKWWSRRNPIDLTTGWMSYLFSQAIETVLQCDRVDAILALGIGYMAGMDYRSKKTKDVDQSGGSSYFEQLRRNEQKQTMHMIEIARKYGKPVIFCSDISNYARLTENLVINMLEKEGIMVYSWPERAARVLAHMCHYSEFLCRLGND
jgi:acyl-CoA synthetase (NDP forming)